MREPEAEVGDKNHSLQCVRTINTAVRIWDMVNLCGTLDHQTLKNLSCILGVSWKDRVSNAEVLRRYGCHSMHAILSTRWLSWFGHVCRLPDYLGPLQRDGIQDSSLRLANPTFPRSSVEWPVALQHFGEQDKVGACGEKWVMEACAPWHYKRRIKMAGETSTTPETDSLSADSLIHLDLRGFYIRRHSLNSWCFRSPNKALEKINFI